MHRVLIRGSPRCVLYPMYLRDTLLRGAERGLYRAHWSADILDEVARNIVASGHATPEGAAHLLGMMRSAFPEAEVTGYQPLISSMLNDPKDRHVAAAAVACGAQLIVTDNLGDFPDVALAPFNLEAQATDAFLTFVFNLDPDVMVDIITSQAAAYRYPPMTNLELLDRHSKHVPSFAQLVHKQFSNQS